MWKAILWVGSAVALLALFITIVVWIGKRLPPPDDGHR